MQFFYNSKTFELRGNAEHKNLDACQFTVVCSDEGSYILFNAWNTKTFNGGLEHRRFVPRSNKQFDNGVETSVFIISGLYLSMISLHGPLYRKPFVSSFTFGAQCIGINKLSMYIKTMYAEAGIDSI